MIKLIRRLYRKYYDFPKYWAKTSTWEYMYDWYKTGQPYREFSQHYLKICVCGHNYGLHYGYSTKDPCHQEGCACKDFERKKYV